MADPYSSFLQHVREIHTLRTIGGLLEWDQETCMPRRGAADRAEQLALIAGLEHRKRTSEELGNLLSQLERERPSDDFARATNIREMRRSFDRAVKIPAALVEEIARVSALAKDAWVKARKESRFADFAPHLERLLDLKRQVARHVGYTTEPYDALMDEFEPGAQSAEIERVFDGLKREQAPLAVALAKAPRQPDASILTREFPQAGQERFNRLIADALGFDFNAGRIDVSTHPFCMGLTPCDVRLTTRYDERFIPAALFGTMHEAGHGLYEQGLDPAHVNTPMAAAVSLGIHESQSRMWENVVGRSRPFWQHYYPLLQLEFPALKGVPLDAWYFAINAVRPSFIRVEADEVTYNLHIMLRFDLERRLISGKLPVKDVPAAWNDGMQALLGITPASDAEGCLQDIHWSMGIFGYFPTYALGNLYAAQFFAQAQRDIPDLEARIARGELRPLLEWLRAKIHRHGQRYRANELVQVVTGRPLSPQPFIDYLNAKFRPLYGI